MPPNPQPIAQPVLYDTSWCNSHVDTWHLRQGFDLGKDPVLQDVTLTFGFLQALTLLLRVQARGLGWLALPCNSFSFMSVAQHQRSWSQPYGSPLFSFVHLGNTICSRTCLLLLVAVARSVTWFLENPLQSAVHTWPFINFLMHNTWLNSRRTSWCDP